MKNESSLQNLPTKIFASEKSIPLTPQHHLIFVHIQWKQVRRKSMWGFGVYSDNSSLSS